MNLFAASLSGPSTLISVQKERYHYFFLILYDRKAIQGATGDLEGQEGGDCEEGGRVPQSVKTLKPA